LTVILQRLPVIKDRGTFTLGTTKTLVISGQTHSRCNSKRKGEDWDLLDWTATKKLFFTTAYLVFGYTKFIHNDDQGVDVDPPILHIVKTLRACTVPTARTEKE
jgi:hypothetical protein